MNCSTNKKVIKVGLSADVGEMDVELPEGAEVLSLHESEMKPFVCVLVPAVEGHMGTYRFLLLSTRQTETGYNVEGYRYVGGVELRQNNHIHHLFVKKVITHRK